MADGSKTVWLPTPSTPTDAPTRRRMARTVNDPQGMQYAQPEAGTYPGIDQTGLDPNAYVTGAAPGPDLGAMAPDPWAAFRQRVAQSPMGQRSAAENSAFRNYQDLIGQAYQAAAATPGTSVLQYLRDAMQQMPNGTTPPQLPMMAQIRNDVRTGR